MPTSIPAAAYRYPSEYLVLGLTLSLVLAVIAITATATVCASAIFVLGVILLAYFSSQSHHQALLRQAFPVTRRAAPELAEIVQDCTDRLGPGAVQVFVARNRALNAYAFGLDSPKDIVVYSALLEVMDADELRFIIGHETGHVALGHTWLNTLVGGMAGIPSSSFASAMLVAAFLWWNRNCELSADRAGLLVCDKPEKAVTALIKLVAGPAGRSRSGLELAYRQIDAEDDSPLGSLSELLASHPMLIRRINEIRSFAASAQYRRLKARLDRQAP